MVTLTFSNFGVELEWDALYVFNGQSTNDPLFSSGNPETLAGFPAGGYYGFSIPGPFTSSHPSGCLTTKFLSDGAATELGWNTSISCNNVCSSMVTNGNDDGPGSLRFSTWCNAEGSVLTFDPALENTFINLNTPIIVNKDMAINYTGSNPPKLKAVGSGPVFDVLPTKSLNLSNVALYSGTGLDGRAINNAGTLNLISVKIYENIGAPTGGSMIRNVGTLNIFGNTEIKE